MLELLVSSAIQVIGFSLLPFLWWFITARKKEKFLPWIGFRRPVIKGSLARFILIILGVSVTYILIMLAVMTLLVGDVDTATSQFEGLGWSAMPSILIYAILQTGLSEEILFRGFIGKRLIHSMGFVKGNTVQALLFGLLHGLPFGMVTGNVLTAIILTLIPGSIGWVQGWLNEKNASGSIVPSWIMHSIMNILSALSTAI